MSYLIPMLQRLLTYMITKLIVALGMSFVTYTGFKLGFDYLKDYLIKSVQGMPADTFAILIMAGFGHAVGIIFGAVAFNAAMLSISKLQFAKGVNP